MIMGYLYKNLKRDFTVINLPSYAEISVSTIDPIFKEHTSMTPERFIMYTKMSEGCEYLVDEDKSIRAVSELMDYDDHTNFTRSFGAMMGMSPSKYRKIYKFRKEN